MTRREINKKGTTEYDGSQSRDSNALARAARHRIAGKEKKVTTIACNGIWARPRHARVTRMREDM